MNISMTLEDIDLIEILNMKTLLNEQVKSKLRRKPNEMQVT